jgi:hypothetical protein
MLQPGPGSVREEKGKIVDDEVVVVCPSQLACQPVIHEPQLWPRLPRVLGDGSRGSEPGGERRSSYGPAEDSQTWWLRRGTPILLTVVASPAPGVVASTHLLLEAGSMVTTVLLVAEAIPGGRCLVPRALGMDRGLPHALGGRRVMLRGVSSLREAELSARRTAAPSRRSLSSPWIRHPSMVDGSGMVRSSIAAAARSWQDPLTARGSAALALSTIRRWTSRAR